MALSTLVEKILKAVRIRPMIGGLEISDTALRFAHFDGEQWQLRVERLAPGILQNGEVKNYGEFVRALKALRAQMGETAKSKKTVSVVVCLSSVAVYNQVFTLPVMEGENLEKAVDLNLQGLSPGGREENYTGWQVAGRDAALGRLEILGAFVKRPLVDDVRRALVDSGFLPIVVESKALALTRILREEASGFDTAKSYVLLDLDSNGLDFLVIRHGRLYFEYFNFWRDIQGEEREINRRTLEASVIRNLHQVLNFYGQHWPDQTAEILVSAGDLNDTVTKVVKENFTLPVHELKLKSSAVGGSEWFIVLGSGLRSLVRRGEDSEVNFLGVEAEEEFHQARLINFIDFWRVLFPVALGVLLVVFALADLFLIRTRRSLEANSLFQLGGEEVKTVQDLESEVRAFNQSVALIRSARQGALFESSVIQEIKEIAEANRITLTRLQIGAPDAPVLLTGEADSETQLRALKQSLETSGRFTRITLPLDQIKPTPERKVSFSLSFVVNWGKTE